MPEPLLLTNGEPAIAIKEESKEVAKTGNEVPSSAGAIFPPEASNKPKVTVNDYIGARYSTNNELNRGRCFASTVIIEVLSGYVKVTEYL